MDPLSLLSELYGQGRDAAEKLRARGLENLEDLCAQSPKALARLLGISEGTAKKMLNEARGMLQENLFETQRTSPAKITPQIPPASSDLKTEVMDMLLKRFR